MSDDRISLQPRRRQIIDAMKKIPGNELLFSQIL